MLSELSELQESNEDVWGISMSFDVETRSKESGEIIQKEYKFSYASEWDKWTFVEYREKRTDDTTRIGDRNWRESRHLVWQDVNETHTIDVPSEVSKALADATGSESVTIQVPRGSINETTYQKYTYTPE